LGSKQKYAFSVLFLAVLTSLLGIGIVVPFLPKILHDLGGSGFFIGIIFAGFSLTRALGMPFWGNWGDRFGRKLFLIIATGGYLLTALGYIIVKDSVPGLGLIRVMNGIVAGISMPVAMSYAGDLTKKAKEGFTMGIFNVAMFTGFGGGPAVGGIIYKHYGYEMVFYAFGAISALALVMLFFLPESKGQPKSLPMWTIYKAVLKRRIVLALFIHRLVLSGGRAAAMAFLPILAVDEWGISEDYVGIVFTAQIWFVNLLQPLFGRLADRMNRVTMVITGSFLASIGYFFIPHTGNFPLLLLACTAIGLFGAFSIPASTAIAVTEGRKLGMGEVMAVFNMGMPMGHLFGFLACGLIMDKMGIAELFYFSGIFSILGVALFIVLLYGIKTKDPQTRAPG
jgi:DHA1 family multidrug resistance protein-like MFS transporter